MKSNNRTRGGDPYTSEAVVCSVNTRAVPRDVKDAFKAQCVRRGRTMTGLIIAFMIECSKPPSQRKYVDLGRLCHNYPRPK